MTSRCLGRSFGMEDMFRDDDWGEERPLVSEAVLTARLCRRSDVLTLCSDRLLRNTEGVCMALAIVMGMWLTTREVVIVPPDYFGSNHPERREQTVLVRAAVVERTARPRPDEIVRPTKRRVSMPANAGGRSRFSMATGATRAGIGNAGLLGLLSERVTADRRMGYPSAVEGVTREIDVLLSGDHVLMSGSSGGSGRRDVAVGIGFEKGYAWGGEDAGLDGVIVEPAGEQLVLRKRGPVGPLTQASQQPIVGSSHFVGGRERSEIIRVVLRNMGALRYAYNHRLRQKPGLKGKLKIRFAVDEFGRVIFCEVLESTIGDPELEKLVVAKIGQWRFESIDKPGDVTEVVYPFVFSM